MAKAVADRPEKALVIVRGRVAHRVIVRILLSLASKTQDSFGVATINELGDFNRASNARGEDLRVFVADADVLSEGVSFFGVRRVFLAAVPRNYGEWVQQCGRAVRMNSHASLPEDERCVTFALFLASLPRGNGPSADEMALMHLQGEAKKLVPSLQAFRSEAIVGGSSQAETTAVHSDTQPHRREFPPSPITRRNPR